MGSPEPHVSGLHYLSADPLHNSVNCSCPIIGHNNIIFRSSIGAPHPTFNLELTSFCSLFAFRGATVQQVSERVREICNHGVGNNNNPPHDVCCSGLTIFSVGSRSSLLSSRTINGVYIPSVLLIVGVAIVKREWVPYAAALAAVLGGYKVFTSGSEFWCSLWSKPLS